MRDYTFDIRPWILWHVALKSSTITTVKCIFGHTRVPLFMSHVCSMCATGCGFLVFPPANHFANFSCFSQPMPTSTAFELIHSKVPRLLCLLSATLLWLIIPVVANWLPHFDFVWLQWNVFFQDHPTSLPLWDSPPVRTRTTSPASSHFAPIPHPHMKTPAKRAHNLLSRQ